MNQPHLIEPKDALALEENHSALERPVGGPRFARECGDVPKVRIVHIAGQLSMGGMEKLLVEHARHIDRNQFELHFISLEDRGAFADEIEEQGWPVTTLNVAPGIRPGLVLRLSHVLRSWRADVVHTHNTKTLLYGGPAARLARVRRVVHTRHGQDCNASRAARLGFYLATWAADYVVCVSKESAALTVGQGIGRQRVQAIWNGIDCSRFPCATPDKPGPVVSVGRLSPEKDFASLINAAASVIAKHPGFALHIAGEGSCRPQLEKMIAERGIGGSVRLLGERRDIPRLLSEASAFVLPSLTEGISLTLLEAMAAGLPVVATAVGGTPEVVIDGTTGVLVPPASPDRLATALCELWLSPSSRVKMGRAGRERVLRDFAVQSMVNSYQDLYLARLPKERP